MKNNSGSLVISGNLEEVSQVRSWLDELLQGWSVSEETVGEIQIAITEFCTNIIRHGFTDDRPGEIELSVALRPEAIEIMVTDDAPSFVPDSTAQLPDRPSSEGGYGQYIIHTLMDTVSHESLGAVGNRTVLVKRI